MSKADELFEKIIKLPLKDLLILCGNSLDSDIGEERISVLFKILEMRLQKRRIAKHIGLEGEE